jgi:hypothetical protein
VGDNITGIKEIALISFRRRIRFGSYLKGSRAIRDINTEAIIHPVIKAEKVSNIKRIPERVNGGSPFRTWLVIKYR